MKWLLMGLLSVPLFAVGELPGVRILDKDPFRASETESVPPGWEVGGDGKIEWDRSGDAAALAFRATAPKQFTFARRTVPLPEEKPAALLLVAEVRMKDLVQGENNWHSGRIMLTYLNAEGGEIRNAYGLDRLEGDTDTEWREVRRQFPVESGATAVKVELQLFYPESGSIAFRNLELRALNRMKAEAWRVEANKRIAAHRMSDLTVSVRDAAGNPVPEADVALRMVRHAYPFGTAVQVKQLLSDKPGSRIYQGVVTNFFNSATFEGALKDRVIERNGIEPAVKALHWLRDRGLTVRGHVLIWPSWKMTAAAYKPLAEDPEALRAAIRTFFRDTLTATEGLIYEWDVLNEPVRHNDLMQLFGREEAVEWFKTAREFAPGVPLMVNENNVLLNAGNRQALIEWVQYLQENGAPIDRVGVQGHMWHRTMPSGQNILQDLDALAVLGIPVVLTEFSANSRFTETDEARYLDELIHAWFSHPVTVGFTFWGFKDDMIWTDNAFFFREDWSLKPAGLAWLRKVYGEWWTEVDLVTDAEGEVSVRGFKGEYELEVRHAGRKIRKAVLLAEDGKTVSFRLDDFSEIDNPDTRLGSRNPWTTGKLPDVRNSSGSSTAEMVSVSLPVQAVATVPRTQPDEGAFSLIGHDLYLKIEVPKQKTDRVELRVGLSESGPKPGRITIHALSHRFVPEAGELGLDWRGKDLTEENAPGRSAVDGGFDLGDARVLLVGTLEVGAEDAGRTLEFSNKELRRLVRESGGGALTLILSGSGADGLSVAGPGHPYLPPPVLTLEIQKD